MSNDFKKSIYLIYRGVATLILFLKEIFGKYIHYMLCNKILRLQKPSRSHNLTDKSHNRRKIYNKLLTL